MEKTAYIVLGGDIDVPWLFGILSKKKKEDLLVGVDSGMEALDRLGLLPDVLLGDFDSISVPLPRGQKTQIVPFR